MPRDPWKSQTSDICVFLNYLLFLERGQGREKDRERNIEVREKHQSVCHSHAPPTRDLVATQACALTENWTGDLLLCRMTPNLLSHTGQDRCIVLAVISSCPEVFAVLLCLAPCITRRRGPRCCLSGHHGEQTERQHEDECNSLLRWM